MILLLGATGLLGHNVLKLLLSQGRRVRCIVRKGSFLDPAVTGVATPGQLELVSGSILDEGLLGDCVVGCKAVVNCAGVTDMTLGSIDDYRPVNTDLPLILARLLGGLGGGTLIDVSSANTVDAGSADSPAEFDHALSYACLAKTGLSLDGVREVSIVVRTAETGPEFRITLRDSDLLLYDSGTPSDSVELTLYFADEDGTFLLTEKRTVQAASHEELPLLALNELLIPPAGNRMRSALPPGTTVRLASVANGVCSVDFNEDFAKNRFPEEQAQQLSVLSVVNTLCELEGIEQVKLLVNGVADPLSAYETLDLSRPLLPDSAAVGPIRQELGEFAGTLCLPDFGDAEGRVRLHRLTVRARARGSALQEEALLLVLFARTAQNGLDAPFAAAPVPLSVKTFNGICQVKLEAGTLPTEDGAREQAMRSIVATLCTLPTVHAVELYEGGAILPECPRSPNADWFALARTPGTE